MALFNPTFFVGIIVLLYLSSFVLFAIIRIITGVSIQRIGYFSIRRLAYTLRDGVKIEVRGLGLNVHRPTFAQPTWLSVVVDELTLTLDITEMEGHKANATAEEDEAEAEVETTNGGPKEAPEKSPKIPSIRRDEGRPSGRSKTWEKLTKIKDQVKRLHRVVNWLRMVDLVATNSCVNIVDVGSLQVGSFTIAVDTRRKMVDRARFFLQGRSDRKGQKQQAEWIMTIRSMLFTADGRESLEILDTASLNIHGFLYEALDGLRDTAVALKLGRVHIPYDDVRHSTLRYKEIRSKVDRAFSESQSVDVFVDQVIKELDVPGSTTHELMQTVSDSKDLISSALRGVKEVQFAVSFIGLTKRVEAVKTKGSSPVLLTASMKEVGIDLHRLDPKSPAHRMYFPSKDIAHEALAAALSISIGLDDGHGKPERIMYIPMATTTVRTTLPSKTVELADEGTAQDRNANILFANSVVTSPSVDLDPRHLPLLLAMLRPKPKPKAQAQPQQRHMLISRLLPKANIKFSMHEPVLRITLPPVQKSFDPDEFDLIISSISSVSLDLESFHSNIEDLHYSLAATTRVQTHNLYYQTCSGERFDLLETETFDLKLQLNATPHVHVIATGNLQTFSVKMVRQEIGDGLRHIIRQLRLNVEPDKMAGSKGAKKSNFLRAMPDWLWHFQMQCSDFSVEVAGVDEGISEETKGVAIQLDSWSAEYRAQRLEPTPQRRQTSRRRASSRGMMSPPDSDILKAVPVSPRKRYHHDGDGRRVAIHVRGFEAFMVESAEKWEIEPFVSMPRFEIAFSTLSDNQGPVFHAHSHVRTLLVQYSLHRHYAVAVAAMILKKAFARTSREVARPSTPTSVASSRRVVGHLSPPGSTPSSVSFSDAGTSRVFDELVVVDVKATLIQIKAEMPADPPLMLHIYGMEAGRHRWSPPFLHSKLIRLYAEAPRMRRVWARVLSIKNGRVDYRESRRKSPGGAVHEERMADIITDTVRLSVPHEMVIHQIFDNIVNTAKAVEQLHHRFKTGTNEYILDKGPEGPKNVPKVSLRSRTVLFELEDGAFEWKLGMIYRAGRVEQMQRQAREEAFRLKVKKLHEEESRRGSSKLRTRSAAPRGRSENSPKFHTRSHSTDSHPRSSTEAHPRGRPTYDPRGAKLGISAHAQISVAEAMHKLHVHNAKSWKQRIDRHYLMAKNGMKDLHSLFGADDMIVADDLDDSENILEVPQRPALLSALINDLHFVIDKPSFPMSELPGFLHRVGKGMPRDMKYSLLVPMNVQISMGEARILLRDYPLPFIHVPAIKPGQSSRLPALSMKTDFVIAEEFRGIESSRKVRVQIVPPRNPDVDGSKEGAFAIDVRRTTSPVKSFSDMTVEIHSANPTRITWGPSYQPAIQDMMMAIESFTKPQLDPSDRVGFWDKIRLNFHSRVRVAWRGDGDVHLALKGSRDPYQVTGNGAGFLMCWRNDVRWNIHTEDDPTRFMTVSSGEYVIAVPDYSHQVREARRGQGEADSIISDSGHKSAAAFKKMVMKLSGKVEVLAGLVFEQAIEKGERRFQFKPHYDVVLKAPQYAAPDKDGRPYDAFRGFRSQHIHLSVAVRAPVDRSWSASNPEPSRSYNTVHLTPRFFTHFFAWWSLFGGPMSLPIRQGVLWPGREKNSKKFGRHLATIKYNLLFAPLFLSHIYKHKDLEDASENAVSATGIKVRFDSFMLDLHQRREEFNTRDRGRGTQSRTSGMKIHAGQLDLVSADIRAISASIKNATADSLKNKSISTFLTEQEDDGHDLSRFTIPDNDLTWIDMDDFVELDWILPTEPNPDTKILPLAYAPRITYFRQTDIGGVIEGDPDRTSPFGQEPTHSCIMSQDDDPRRVQRELIRRRLEQLDVQMETHKRTLGEIELWRIRGDDADRDLKMEFEALSRHTVVLGDKKTFLEGMLKEMQSRNGEPGEESESTEGNGSGDSTTVDEDTVQAGEEFASDFKNRFVVHNMQLKWNNTLRNIILRYIHQVSQRRGFVYYLSRPAIKFILDIVEEQTKSKTAKNGAAGTPGDASEGNKTDREIQKEIEDRIRKILQDGRKFASAEDAEDAGPQSSTMADLCSGIAEGFTPQNSYHVRVIAPQIQLQSDKNKKHVVLITAKGMELKVVEVMDKDRLSDNVSGLVQRRFLVNMDSTQFFVTHQKWFSTQLVSMYSGSTYGIAQGSSWPPWVPMEVMVDFEADPFGFKRVVQKTSAMLRYDKYNTLRLKYNDEVNTQSEGTYATSDPEQTESRMDNLWVEFPQARALCNSSQYYAIYVIVLDLLMYSEPAEKHRNERLEKIMLASDFSDLRGAPEAVLRLQERVRQLEDIKTHFQIHSKYLDKKGWKDRLNLERDLAACEDELFFMMKAITTSQRKLDSSASSALLKWSISVKEIVWQLIRDNNEPLVELQLKDVEYDRTDNADGSHINLIQVGKILGLNLLPDAIYPAMIAPYVEGDRAGFDTGTQPMIRVYWYMLEAIAGIPVMDHFEVNLFPLKIQLEREVGNKLFEYIFPGMDGDKPTASGKNDSPFMIKQTLGDDENTDEDDSLAGSVDRLGSSHADNTHFSTRAGSLELRLRPTFTSEPTLMPTSKQKAVSIHSGDGHSFRLFRSGTGFRTAGKKPSYESLRGNNVPRPGIIPRSSTGFSSKNELSSNSEVRRGSRFALRKQSNTEEAKAKKSDDLTKMMTRASNYMTFAYIKMPSVVLCLSYKGKGERNFSDVHDFVFRLPTIEYRNKTWSNLDLAMALKNRVIKALISHTGAIIGNKFSRHRPNTAQQSKLRELATSSVLLSTPQLSESRDNSGDDSSSLYGTSPVDFSRSPPRSIARSQTSIPGPSSRSSSIASSRSQRSGHVVVVTNQGGGAIPAFMTPPSHDRTPTAAPPSEAPPSRTTFGGLLLRPSSSGGSRLFGGGGNGGGNDSNNFRQFGGVSRPNTSAGPIIGGGGIPSNPADFDPDEVVVPLRPHERKKSGGSSTTGGGGGGGFFREKLSALKQRVKYTENPSISVTHRSEEENSGSEDEGGSAVYGNRGGGDGASFTSVGGGGGKLSKLGWGKSSR
ncbi:Mitochondrial protein from FMP27 domain containing protein [Rhypophila decipiens]